MKDYLFLALVFVILLIALMKRYLSKDGRVSNQPGAISGLTAGELDSISIKPLLTPAELEFSKLLDQAIPELRVMY